MVLLTLANVTEIINSENFMDHLGDAELKDASSGSVQPNGQWFYFKKRRRPQVYSEDV